MGQNGLFLSFPYGCPEPVLKRSVLAKMPFFVGCIGTISYLPWTWNTWGAAAHTRNETGSTSAAGLEVAAGARGGGEALVKDYKTGEPTDWGKAVQESFAKATAGVPLV
jgi:hypothetical protein